MNQTPREVVKRALTFSNPERIPRDLWFLPWAEKNHPQELERLQKEFPSDFVYAPCVYNSAKLEKGAPYEVGEYTDPWGCVFTNLLDGIIGEVKTALISDINDLSKLYIPYEMLPGNKEEAIKTVNKFCKESNNFIFAGCCPRPWERMQFLRTTQGAMMDLMTNKKAVIRLLEKIQEFYMSQLQFWVQTDVDALLFMDDWGSQNNLLIPPKLWREIFKPLYREYARFSHENNKFLFMHSDGNILEIYPDLIEIGIDALNSQLFCMDLKKISKIAKGRITFWGEIDRQHILPCKDTSKAIDAVDKVANDLYQPEGGIIAQFEFSPGINPSNAFSIYKRWDEISRN